MGLKYLAQEHNIMTLTSSGSRGGLGHLPPLPLLLDQSEAWRAEKKFLETRETLTSGAIPRASAPPTAY